MHTGGIHFHSRIVGPIEAAIDVADMFQIAKDSKAAKGREVRIIKSGYKKKTCRQNKVGSYLILNTTFD